MSDLISREAAIEQIERRMKYLVGDKGVSPEAFIRFLKNRPTVDVEPARHGKWIKLPPDKYGYYSCSKCNTVWNLEIIFMRYCPRCGAKMEGDINEAD